MRHPAKIALAIAAAAVGLAACGGGDDETSATSSAAQPATELVSVKTVDGTDVLADADGKTLYTAPVEKDRIRCVEACVSFWAPLTASKADADEAAAEVDAELGVVKRPEGEQQLTLDGLPLYTFAEEGAGELKGDGFVDDFQGTHFEWQAAKTEGGGEDSAPPSDDRGSGIYGY